MAPRPIFAATHPRACSTAFERVFMTRRDCLESFHEPFGDPFHYGPELMSERFRNDSVTRNASGMSKTTYKDILDGFKETEIKGKRVFLKDMAQYLIAPDGRPTTIAPSLGGCAEKANPTVLPVDILKRFHFTFLIRHPRRSIPSYYRCTVPPRKDVTGWEYFDPGEAGYVELVRLFDFLSDEGIIDKANVTVVDADDMLDNPEKIIRQYCERTGLDFKPEMLQWNKDDDAHAAELFAKWNGWHDDALQTSSLQARTHRQTLTVESENAEWTEKYGPEAQKIIRKTVDENTPYYEYLKQFCMPA